MNLWFIRFKMIGWISNKYLKEMIGHSFLFNIIIIQSFLIVKIQINFTSFCLLYEFQQIK